MFLTVVILMLTGVLLMFAELFVPGGILGLLGMTLMGIAVYLCFREYGSQVGLGVMLLSVVLTITAVVSAFTVIPKTAIGRAFILSDSTSKERGYHSDSYIDAGLVGKEGVAESELRPAGIALVDGNRIDVVTDSEFVEHGSRIQVLRVDGNRVVVKQV
ncbi:MAG: NfeD family protein [Candidatus Hinthialibacter antarcticus]|nr:NfeD family protein [Candidatus Hinthialibacter antarcticus]